MSRIPEKYKAYMAVVLGLHNADDITVDKMAVTRGIKTFDYHEKYNKLTYVISLIGYMYIYIYDNFTYINNFTGR